MTKKTCRECKWYKELDGFWLCKKYPYNAFHCSKFTPKKKKEEIIQLLKE